MISIYFHKPWKVKDRKAVDKIDPEALETCSGKSYYEHKYLTQRVYDFKLNEKFAKIKESNNKKNNF